MKERRDDVTQIHRCYEAGAFGYVLHRKLEALGVHNAVVQPRNWDEYGKKVSADQRDALALCGMLDRYLAGNREALCVIRVPSGAEECACCQTRQRDSLVADRRRLSNRGLSTERYYGFDSPGRWWRPRAFARLATELPTQLHQTLKRWHKILLEIDEQLEALSREIEAARPEELHTGLGH